MNRHLITLAIFAAAITFYVSGMVGGGSVLLVAGFMLELWFWVRLLRGGQQPSSLGAAKKR